MHTRVHTCMHTHHALCPAHVHSHTHACTHVHTHAPTCMHIASWSALIYTYARTHILARVRTHMHVYMCAHAMHACTHMHICTYTLVHAHASTTLMCAGTSMYTCIGTHTCMHMCMYMHAYNTCMYACSQAHAHVHTQIRKVLRGIKYANLTWKRSALQTNILKRTDYLTVFQKRDYEATTFTGSSRIFYGEVGGSACTAASEGSEGVVTGRAWFTVVLPPRALVVICVTFTERDTKASPRGGLMTGCPRVVYRRPCGHVRLGEQTEPSHGSKGGPSWRAQEMRGTPIFCQGGARAGDRKQQGPAGLEGGSWSQGWQGTPELSRSPP